MGLVSYFKTSDKSLLPEVTRNEVTAFKEVFYIPKRNENQAAKVFNLARKDVAGFESYAKKISIMFKNDPQALFDLMEGLFHIAVSDGNYHPAENEFLQKVSNKIINNVVGVNRVVYDISSKPPSTIEWE